MAINIPIISSLDSKGFEKAMLEFKSLETNSQKAGFVMEKAFLPAVAALTALTAVAGFSVKAAIEDAAAQAQLAKTLQNVTSATDAQIAAVEQSISAMQMATGVSVGELRPAFAALVRGTKDLSTANTALTLAMDIAAATGSDLQSVSDALALAYGGNTKALAKLSPELKTAIKEGASLDQVMGTLSKTFGGSAAVAAGTAEGQFKRLNVALDEAKESIGKALLPAIEAVLPSLILFGNWAAEHVGIITAVGVAIAAVATALVAYKVAQVIANAVTVVATALNFANAASLAAVATAGTAGVAAATIAAGLVVIGGALLIFQNQNKAAATATTDLGSAAKSTAVDMGRLGFTLDYIRGVKIDEYMTKVEKEAKKAASGVKDIADKAKIMADKTKEAADVLRDYMGKVLDDAKTKLETAQEAFDNFSNSVSSVISDSVNFGAAFDKNNEKIKEAKDRLKEATEALKEKFVPAINLAKDSLKKAQDGFNNFGKSVSNVIKNTVNFAKAFEEGGKDAGLTFFSALQKQANKAKEFANLIEQLLAAGLSEQALRQVIDAGADSGAAIAAELLQSSGNILRANELVAETDAIAAQIGTLSASQFYGAGVTNAQEYLIGIEEAMVLAQIELNATFAEGGTTAALTFLTALQEQATKASEFAELVKQLLAAGLSQEALQQVIDAGIDSGSAIAKELLKSSGNVLKANELVAQTNAIAESIGKLSASKFYAAGVSNAQQYLAGIEAAIAVAEARLKTKGINFADVKGIAAGFTESISAPSVSSPIVDRSTIRGGTSAGGGGVTINVNSQLATKSEVGQAVTDALRAYNRTSGPLQLEIA